MIFRIPGSYPFSFSFPCIIYLFFSEFCFVIWDEIDDIAYPSISSFLSDILYFNYYWSCIFVFEHNNGLYLNLICITYAEILQLKHFKRRSQHNPIQNDWWIAAMTLVKASLGRKRGHFLGWKKYGCTLRSKWLILKGIWRVDGSPWIWSWIWLVDKMDDYILFCKKQLQHFIHWDNKKNQPVCHDD